MCQCTWLHAVVRLYGCADACHGQVHQYVRHGAAYMLLHDLAVVHECPVAGSRGFAAPLSGYHAVCVCRSEASDDTLPLGRGIGSPGPAGLAGPAWHPVCPVGHARYATCRAATMARVPAVGPAPSTGSTRIDDWLTAWVSHPY